MARKLNWQVILQVLGFAVLFESVLLLLPLLVAGIYHEQHMFQALLVTIGITFACGGLLSRINPKKQDYFARDGLIAVGLIWIVLSLAGALPFRLSGEIPSYVDSFFETVSGFTTTGATILTDVEALSRSAIFWRSLTHWVGGMGVLVLLLAVLPKTGEQAMHLMRAEAPGPSISKLVPRLRTSAMILYGLYLLLSLLELLFLLAGGMPFFDSLIHTFGTAGTGGFSLYAASIAHYHSVYFETVITVFMFLFGVNFNLYFFLVMRDVRPLLKDTEFRTYLGITIGATVLIALNILHLYGSLATALRYSSFQVVSVMTTTGYATADFNLWPTFSKMILFFLMVVGAMAGSTGGGIKVVRLLIVLRTLKLNVQKLVHPQKVEALTLSGKPVPREECTKVLAFFCFWFILIALCTVLVALDGLDFESTISAVYTCIGNVGLGFGICGPTGSFAPFSAFSKLVLSFAMLAGRLEIYPIVILSLPLFAIFRSSGKKRTIRRRD